MSSFRKLKEYEGMVCLSGGKTVCATFFGYSPHEAIERVKQEHPDWQSIRLYATGRGKGEWIVARDAA